MIHFVGIGGSGMFALACIAIEMGYKVSGSDIAESKNLKELSKKGANTSIGHSADNVKENTKILVYSGAIEKNNPEILMAHKMKIRVLSRSQFMGMITSKFKNLIAVAGSHGKTTTTAMITNVLLTAGKDPTSIIGAHFEKIGGNSRLGKSDIAVCEACEYLDSFLDLTPKVGVILNIDFEHIDYFKTIENEKKSFLEFADKSQTAIVNIDDKNSHEVFGKLIEKKAISYGVKNNDAEFNARNIHICDDYCYKFDIFHKNEKISSVKLNIYGEHNVLNALASFVSCYRIGVKIEDISRGLESFNGTSRRFEFLEKVNGIKIFDDFAHHPTEIDATLKIAKNMNFKNIWLIFQPHTFSRTYLLLDDFAKSLSVADHVIITEILPVREKNIYGIKSEDLVKKIKGAVLIKNPDKIGDYLKENAKKGDMIMTMGGGDIYKYADLIIKKLKE